MNETLVESVKIALGIMERTQVEGDIYGVVQQAAAYSIQKGHIGDSSETEEMGLGIRILRGDAVGFGYCVPGKEEEGVKRAFELSKVSPALTIDLPSPEKVSTVPVCDQKIRGTIEDGTGADFVHMMIEGATSVKADILAARGELLMTAASRVIANTQGIFFQEDSTVVSCGVHTIIPGSGTSLTAREIRSSRQFDIDFHDVGREAGRKVLSMREKSHAAEDTYPVILSPDVLAPLLWFSVVPSLLGEHVRKGRSVYQGEGGNRIASGKLTITDNPTLPWGLGSGGVDDEGVSSSKISVIADGVLTTLLYDLKDSAQSSTEPTGNGIRADFKTPPETKDRNIIVKGEEHKRETLVEDKGLYVDKVMGVHTANPVSGDFSVVAAPALLLEHGEVTGRVDSVMLSGNTPEVLKKVELANDYKGIYFAMGSRKIFAMYVPTALSTDIIVSRG
jgi:PmbA protein